jgi:DNA-binding CsgD family transcriptional regulator
MRKKEKAAAIIKLLKKGMTPIEITQRMDASYNYAWKLKKDLEKAAQEAVEEIKTTVLDTSLSWAPPAKPKPGEFVQADTNVDAILNTRATTYGAFKDVAQVAQEMKNAIRMCNNSELEDDQIEALDMIASKIARILNGNPDHVDSWVDIAGYAQLVADRLQGTVR